MAQNKLSASISVSRRPRTDNEEELVRVITNQTSTSSLSSFTQAVKDLEGAGIVVGSSDVTIKGSQVKVQNGSTTAAMFSDGKINASLIEVDKLTSTAADGRKIVISGGIMEIFGTVNSSQPNIVFGVDETGAAILSYYSNEGTLLYDLGPSGLDAKGMTSASVTAITLVLMSNVTSASTISKTETINDQSYNVCYDSSVQNALFGFSQTYDIVDTDYSGYQPAKSKATVTLYKYTAARLNGTYVADSSRGLTTAALAEAANGKVFTSSSVLASGGKLTNLASGTYIAQNEKSLLKYIQYSSAKKMEYYKYMLSYVTYADGISTNAHIYSLYTKTSSRSGASS